jgi:hypothetical protein
MSFTENNHYVPQWYQKRFLHAGLKEQKFYYLDLKPERIRHPDGEIHLRNECRRLGPVNCFAKKHLYTLFFGNLAADVIEKRFFGNIDRYGAEAVEYFSNYAISSDIESNFHNILR